MRLYSYVTFLKPVSAVGLVLLVVDVGASVLNVTSELLVVAFEEK